jgi:NAD(P)H dehydrogenase (quinone)
LKISILLANPHPGSFNHAIAETVMGTIRQNSHQERFHDLFVEGFDPVLPYAEISRDATLPEDITRHCEKISAADGIVFVHPDWWGMPPAILKGWTDRVLRAGVTYRFLEDGGEGIPEGLLKAKAAFIFNTSNTPRERELEAFGDPLERLWKDCICSFCGVPAFHRKMLGVIVTSTGEQWKASLNEVRELTLARSSGIAGNPVAASFLPMHPHSFIR